MNVKFKMPKLGSNMTGKDWWKELSLTFIATTISIVLTFGTAQYFEHKQKLADGRLMAMMVIHDMDNTVETLTKLGSEHVAMAEIPKYEKLLFFTDAAVIPVPTPTQRRQQIHYMNYVCHALGIEEPRISLIHCAEKVSAKAFPYTADYLDIIAEAQTGQFGRCIIDGPLDLKTSLDAVSLHEKGIHSVIDGQADALIFPDIVAGNVFYKTLTLFAYAKTAGVLQGTQCPCVVSSRADSPESKYYSLALAAI